MLARAPCLEYALVCHTALYRIVGRYNIPSHRKGGTQVQGLSIQDDILVFLEEIDQLTQGRCEGAGGRALLERRGSSRGSSRLPGVIHTIQHAE